MTEEEFLKNYEIVSEEPVEEKKPKKLTRKQFAEQYDIVSDEEGVKAEDLKTPSMLDTAKDFAGGMLDLLDVGRAGVATGTMAALKEDESVPQKLGEFKERLFTEGPTAATTQSPRGKDILMEAGVPDASFEDIDDPIMGQVPLIKKASLADIGGAVLDIGMDPLSYTGAVSRAMAVPVKAIAKKVGNAQATRAISKYISNTKYLREGVSPEAIGAQAFEDDLLKLLANQTKLQEKLVGKYDLVEVKGPKKSGFFKKKSPSKKGMIEKLGDEVESVLKSVNDIQTIKPKKKYFRNQVSQDLFSQMEEVGMELNPKAIPKAEDLIDNLLGPKDSFTLPELYDAKRRLNSQIKSREFYKNLDETQTFKNEVMIALTRKIDDTIVKSLGKVPLDTPRKQRLAKGLNMGDFNNFEAYYTSQNKRMKSLLDLRDIAKTEAFKELKGPDLTNYVMQMLGMGTMAGLVSTLGEYPMYGAMIGAGIEGVRKTGKFIEKAGPLGVARGAKALEKGATPLMRSLPQIRRMSREENYRKPQSVAESIEMTPLSRNTQEIMSQPQLLLGKIAQQRPEVYDMVREAMRQGGMAFDNVVKQLVIESPFLFEQDKYNRIDGKILDPANKAQAIKDVNMMQELSPVEKSEIIDRLNKTGEFTL